MFYTKSKLTVVLLLAALLMSATSQGQWRDVMYERAHTEGHIDVGGTAGLGFYHGDLEAEWFPQHGDDAITFGLFFKKFRNKTFGYRFGANYFSNINAHDSTSVNQVERERNLRFRSNIFEVNAGIELNFIPFGIEHYKWTPYVFGGLNIFYFNPYTDSLDGEGKIFLKPLGTEGQFTNSYPDRVPYNLISTGLYFGGGIKFLISEKVLLGAEVGFRYNSTDYLDDVSRTYVNLDTLQNSRGIESANFAFRGDELESFTGDYPNNGYTRGNPNSKDWYYSGTITIGYYFDVPERSRRYPFTKCVDTKESNPRAY